MRYSWKIVLSCGKEYVVVNEYNTVSDMLGWVFGNAKHMISTHDLVGGGNVLISSRHVASIEFNKDLG